MGKSGAAEMTRLYCFHVHYSLRPKADCQLEKVCHDCGAVSDTYGKWPVVDVLEQWPQAIEEKP
jgi:hypothetical protein